jgi:hypothetical protein
MVWRCSVFGVFMDGLPGETPAEAAAPGTSGSRKMGEPEHALLAHDPTPSFPLRHLGRVRYPSLPKPYPCS